MSFDIRNHSQWVFEGPETQALFKSWGATLTHLSETIPPAGPMGEQAEQWTKKLGDLMLCVWDFLFNVQWMFAAPWFECLTKQKDRIQELLFILDDMSKHAPMPERRRPGMAFIQSLIRSMMM